MNIHVNQRTTALGSDFHRYSEVQLPAISVVGLGYVGIVSCACFSDLGHPVIGVDIDQAKITAMNAGVSPIIETGLGELLEKGRQQNLLSATSDLENAVLNSDVTFVSVNTPTTDDGGCDMTAIKAVAKSIGLALKKKAGYHIVVLRCSVPPGTTRDVFIPRLEEWSGKKADRDFGVCFNPEFLRESTAIDDFRSPPKTVIGASDQQAADWLAKILEPVDAEPIFTTLDIAEMVKYTDNVWHAVKVSFGNEIGRLCHELNIDGHGVMDIFCQDTVLNISPYYLKPGFAYGGSCLPKEVRAIKHLADKCCVDIPMIASLPETNDIQIESAVRLILESGASDIGICGLTFKPNTDDLRESPAVALAGRLMDAGLNVYGTLLAGVSIFAFSTYWPDLFGVTPDTYDFMVSGFGQFIGGMATLHGLVGAHRTIQAQAQRKALEQTTGTFGTADFADAEAIEAKGLFDPHGLYLGLHNGQPIFHKGKAHLLTCAPARQGKGISTVIPNALHYPGSMVITDPKGELAAVTGAHRENRFGQKIAYFNPYRLHGLPQHRINGLEDILLSAGDPQGQRELMAKARRKAFQLYPEPEDGRNRVFRDGARDLLAFSPVFNALFEPESCTLPGIYRDIANPRRLRKKLDIASDSDALGGALADMADDILQQMDDTPELFGSFRAGAIQQVSIYEPSGYLADAVSGSDISLADLKSGDTTLYLMMPPERIASEGAALGLIVNEAIAAVSRSSEEGEALFLLDEFANIGRLSGLAESLTTLPGLGVRVWMIVQEEAELVRLYGPNTAQTIKSQSEVRQYFAVNNATLAQSLSRELGTRTVRTRSHNLGQAVTDEVGESIGEAGQPLMRPEEIMQLGPSDQLLMVNGLKPILGQRIPFWHVDPWNDWAETNPVEGETPTAEAFVRLRYTLENED